MKGLFHKFLDVLIPPVCTLCNEPVSENATLCPECFSKLRFITKPHCKICGRPFEFSVSEETICAECLVSQPLFTKARSVVIYDDMARKLVLAFKNGDKLYIAPLLTKLMAQVASEFIEEVDVVMPIPLHRWRLLKRKYNQSAILARKLARHFHKTYNPDVLKRVRSTPNQGHLSARERKKNVANAFRVRKGETVKGKTVLLVDDVLTTGATTNECSRMLLKAGVKQVYVLTFASTVLDKTE